MIFEPVFTPVRRRNGKIAGGEYTPYQVSIDPGERIVVLDIRNGTRWTYNKGDYALYDSDETRDLFGRITGIGKKSISITNKSGIKKSVNISKFCTLNKSTGFDVEASKVKNEEILKGLTR